jgi:hypothetical protein
MRYTVIHCRNPKCLLKVWVAPNQLGRRGSCPRCGGALQAPAVVPQDEWINGPAIMQVQDEKDFNHALAATA